MKWFTKNILSLLPQLYRSKKEYNDIEIYLRNTIAPVLDFIKNNTDNFTKNLNIESAHEKFLQLIGDVLGIQRKNYSIKTYRQKLRQAILEHKRKCSYEGLLTDSLKIDKFVVTNELHPDIIRFNSQNFLNKKHITGKKYNNNSIFYKIIAFNKQCKENF